MDKWSFYSIGGGWAKLCPSCSDSAKLENGEPDSKGYPEIGTGCDGECGTCFSEDGRE